MTRPYRPSTRTPDRHTSIRDAFREALAAGVSLEEILRAIRRPRQLASSTQAEPTSNGLPPNSEVIR